MFGIFTVAMALWVYTYARLIKLCTYVCVV